MDGYIEVMFSEELGWEVWLMQDRPVPSAKLLSQWETFRSAREFGARYCERLANQGRG